MIHEWLIFEFTTETTWIADAVPGFDADERCLLAVWTPKGNNGCTKVNGYLRLTVSTQEFGTVELALVDLDGIVAPGVIGKLHETILCFDEGYFVHLVRAVAVTVKCIHQLSIVETDASALIVACLHARNIEGGMTSYLEVDFTGIVVADMPDDANLIVVEDIADGEGEVVGVDLVRLLGGLEGESDFALTLVNQLKLGVAGKTVTWQMVFFAIYAIGPVVNTADDGEKDRRVARPELGIGLPEVFLTFIVLDALELGTLL